MGSCTKENALAALCLEAPSKIPRTEYSAHGHWDLIKAVTGIDVSAESDRRLQREASSAFVKAWNYGMMWSIWAHSSTCMNGHYTKMGHATYAAGGVDFSETVSCPFEDPEDVLAFRPHEFYTVPDKKTVLEQINAKFHRMNAMFPDCVNMTGSYISCFSGLIEMFGWEMMLMAAGMDPKGFGEVVESYGKFIMQYFEILAESDSDVIMIHDDLCWTSGPVMAPEWYREYVFPILKKETMLLKDCNKKVLFTSDGNYTEFVDDIAKCGVDGFVLEPTTDLGYIAQKYGKTHVIVGNADTRILLSGTKEDIEAEVKRCMDIGKHCPGFFMAVGNHIPSNTPVENALYYNEMYEKYSVR
jgi:uroporphyrinogen-III decarboxylase